MTLKIKYFAFMLILHGAIGYLAYLQLEEQKLWFFVVELGLLITFSISIFLYRAFIRPLKFMARGVDAIQDEDFNVKFVKIGSKEMDKLIEVYNQMIDNIREERIQVQEQHYFLQKLITASPAGIIILNYDDEITEVNPQAQRILNLKNWYGKPIHNFNHPLINALATLEVNTSKVIAIDGVESYKCQSSDVIHQGFKRKFLMIQELSKEILAAEKRAYGKVIRMMAHEVNNSIGAINSILNSLVEFYPAAHSEYAEDITESLEVAIDRNDKLNQFMRNFASVIRLPEPYKEPVELNELVKNITKLMEFSAREQSITFELNLFPKAIPLKLDIRQMEQALVNIIKNAMEAIEENGIIRLETTQNTLTILDNGRGISKEDMDKLFTPFFSTKTTGQGVGLTLVREIMMNHHIQFSLKMIEGWTKFEMRFGQK